MDLSGKSAIVTGGASGLGEATVRHLAGKGAAVVILDMNEDRGQALASELGGSVHFHKTDVTSEEDVAAAIKVALDESGRLDIAVNCAGIGPPVKILDREGNRNPLDHYKKIVGINLVGTFNVLSQAAEAMAKNAPGEDGERGVIINTASIAAFEGQVGQTAYASSKGGVVGLTLPAARELSRNGIRVNTIAPGFIHTPLFDSLPEKAIESLVEQVQYPKRLGKPSEYASLVGHIVENRYLNGETIRMDAAVRMAPR
ncbi:3-hydroxyacyl-CoA dehydrogenase [Kordiimonas sediminis]|uniref:3-hydroxyacyl-CoA dehydrogenase n=1 Tax=Kordiimonas sediminis TaxID=1735581 RepID=A0A919E787_9PROT|nr:3-hydroxyacyl-CoA dehydrogenase [Kordiimonas sediminis]GHF20824.1 3-hydroxyacyl-CoA dehydrogenase [Kordiimonas sediminis]